MSIIARAAICIVGVGVTMYSPRAAWSDSARRRCDQQPVQPKANAVGGDDTLRRTGCRAIGTEEKEVRCAAEAERSLGPIIPRLGDVQVQEIDTPSVLRFQPVHDGRHGLAAESPGVEKLHELRAPGAGKLGNITRVIPHAVETGGSRVRGWR
jgi:hypothetical protein